MPRSTTLLGLVAVLFGLAACDNPVGRICDLGVEDPGMTSAVMGSPSLDCQSKLCLKVPVSRSDVPEGFRQLAANRGMCTSECESDGDCDKVPESPCVTGFTCGIPLVVGPFCCQKYCICKDYVVVPEGGNLATPEACEPSNASNNCCNLDGRAGNPQYPNCPPD
ncbi:MAG: hypothetical protein HS111_13910 [Kofleriaceae bacterium]|nr:hypothetical protein [Kofleriaceae bacterium]MCL4228783.1 hypothetical protein [Myxococcales bacterium]